MPSSSSSVCSWSDSHTKTPNHSNSDEKDYDSEGNELYVVEEIRDKRRQYDPKTKKTIWLYQLKWKGYSDRHMTWEPQSNLDCPDLLQQFEMKWNKTHRDRDSDASSSKRSRSSHELRKHKNKSNDSDFDLNKPSTSSLSKTNLKQSEKKSRTDSSKKRRILSDSDQSDSSDDGKRKKLSKPAPKRVKEARKAKTSERSSANKSMDRDEHVKNKPTKKRSHSDDDSDSNEDNKLIKDSDNDVEGRVISRPGPRRVKEARLAKMKVSETPKEKPNSDNQSDESLNKRTKKQSVDSDNDSYINLNNDNKDSDDEKTKQLMSKPGPKRAKEARLARLNSLKQTPNKPKEDSEESSENKNRRIDSDSESDKAFKLQKNDNLDDEKRIMLSRPGPRRAKEARIARLNLSSTPKTTEIEISCDKEESPDKSKVSSDVLDDNSLSDSRQDSVSNVDSMSNKADNSTKLDNDRTRDEEMTLRERILSRPGPKAAKEARIARLTGLDITSKESQNNSDEKESKLAGEQENSGGVDNCDGESIKSADKKGDKAQSIGQKNTSAKLTVNCLSNDSEPSVQDNSINYNTSGLQEEQRKKLSKPGPKRAKEARLKKIDQNTKNSSILEETEKCLDKRTDSTDSLDAIMSIPVPQQQSIEMEQKLEAEISQNDHLTEDLKSDDVKPAPDSKMVNSADIESLAKIGNYVNIEITQYIDQLTNALSIQNGGLDMEKPGFIKKQLDIKPFPLDTTKNPEKIISAFYNGNKLCFLIKWPAINRCDVIDSNDLNKNCPQMVIDYYQSKLRFS